MSQSRTAKTSRLVRRHDQGHHKVLAPACPKCQVAIDGLRLLMLNRSEVDPSTPLSISLHDEGSRT